MGPLKALQQEDIPFDKIPAIKGKKVHCSKNYFCKAMCILFRVVVLFEHVINHYNMDESDIMKASDIKTARNVLRCSDAGICCDLGWIQCSHNCRSSSTEIGRSQHVNHCIENCQAHELIKPTEETNTNKKLESSIRSFDRLCAITIIIAMILHRNAGLAVVEYWMCDPHVIDRWCVIISSLYLCSHLISARQDERKPKQDDESHGIECFRCVTFLEEKGTNVQPKKHSNKPRSGSRYQSFRTVIGIGLLWIANLVITGTCGSIHTVDTFAGNIRYNTLQVTEGIHCHLLYGADIVGNQMRERSGMDRWCENVLCCHNNKSRIKDNCQKEHSPKHERSISKRDEAKNSRVSLETSRKFSICEKFFIGSQFVLMMFLGILCSKYGIGNGNRICDPHVRDRWCEIISEFPCISRRTKKRLICPDNRSPKESFEKTYTPLFVSSLDVFFIVAMGIFACKRHIEE